MAHEISIKADGTAEMAFSNKFGGRDAIWHRLGNELPEDATMPEWIAAAGMDWEAIPTPVTFDAGGGFTEEFDNQRVIYRSDTKAPLSIVSGKYKIIQPREILEFFEDMIDLDEMKLTTAGVLYGGRRFWAMADTGRAFDARDNDAVNGKILLTTSLDGTLATQAMFTSVRVVCNNTLRMAVDGQTRGRVRVTHRSVFDPKELKKKMGLYDESFEKFRATIRHLAEAPVEEPQVRKLLNELMFDPKRDKDNQPRTIPGNVEGMIQLFHNGIGNKGESYWDVVNAVTEYIDYGAFGRQPDTQAWEAWYGKTADLKARVLELAVEATS